MTGRKKTQLTAFLWHRRIGLIAIILIVILSITGILLNHTDRFDLDEKYVDNSLILDWYGLEPEDEPINFRAGDHQISQWSDQIFFDFYPLQKESDPLRGAIKADQIIIIGLTEALLLVTEQGDLIERVPVTGDVRYINRIGTESNALVVQSEKSEFYKADKNISKWHSVRNKDIKWSDEITIDQEQREQLLRAYRGEGLTMERVILDLHSGRIFGHYGIYIMDAAAIALLWLSFSGLWVWHKRRKKQRSKKHYIKHHRL